jgi:hypothetical protein
MLKTVIYYHPPAQTLSHPPTLRLSEQTLAPLDAPVPQGGRSREKTAGVASGYVEAFPEARTKVGKERVLARLG